MFVSVVLYGCAPKQTQTTANTADSLSADTTKCDTLVIDSSYAL